MVNKKEDDLTNDKKEKVQHNLKAKTIMTIVIGLDEFLCVSHYDTDDGCRTVN